MIINESALIKRIKCCNSLVELDGLERAMIRLHKTGQLTDKEVYRIDQRIVDKAINLREASK